jgi:ubiquinone biosynthesis protein COQ4
MQIDAITLSQSSPAAIDRDAELAPPPPARPVDWPRALRALRALLADPDQTEKAFEIFLALDGDQEELGFQRFHAHPTGRRLLHERPDLLAVLTNRERLHAMPGGSFGRAYLAYLERTGLDPAGLVQLKSELEARACRDGEAVYRLDPAREWFRNRTILMHDLWHVLTGYGTDPLGESALLPFSFAQLGGRANGLLTAGATARGGIEFGPSFLRYMYQAWHRGRRAAWLMAMPYEELLPQSLDTVRAFAAIVPAETAHPAGIWRGGLEGVTLV